MLIKLQHAREFAGTTNWRAKAMSRYFFDIYDNDHFAPDYTGVELEGIGAAKEEAKRTLPDIMKNEPFNGDQRDFVAIVKDEVGQDLLRVTLSLDVETLFQGPAAKPSQKMA
jgi:hypothetical protein